MQTTKILKVCDSVLLSFIPCLPVVVLTIASSYANHLLESQITVLSVSHSAQIMWSEQSIEKNIMLSQMKSQHSRGMTQTLKH